MKLKSGAEFTVKQVQKVRDSVMVQIDRAQVESINGKPLPPPLIVGSTAPVFSATDTAGAAHTAPVAGSPTIIQFWASWCPYCRKDLELMRSLNTDFAPRGLKIIAVSIDQDLEKLSAFLKDNPLPYTVIPLRGQPDQGQAIAEMYEVQGVPAYYVVDAKGVIVQTSSGSLTQQNAQAELSKALNAIVKSADSLPAH